MNWTMPLFKTAFVLLAMGPGLVSAADLPIAHLKAVPEVQLPPPSSNAASRPEIIRLAWDRVGSMA